MFTLEHFIEIFPAHTLLLNCTSFPTTTQPFFFIHESILEIELFRVE